MKKPMRRPTISTAKKLAEEYRAVQAIVILFDNDNVAAVSYGDTKASCARVARTLDAIVDGIGARKIPSPAAPSPGGLPPRFDQGSET